MSNLVNRLGLLEDLSEIEFILDGGTLVITDNRKEEEHEVSTSSLAISRMGAYIRIKENCPIAVSIENSNARPTLGYYREGKDGMTKIEKGLNIVLAHEGITDEDILEAIKENFKNPFIEGEERSNTTSKKVNKIIS